MTTRRDFWLGVVTAAMLLSAPSMALAKDGADDTVPEAPKPEKPEKPGVLLAKDGADDTVPEAPKPEKPERPEKPGRA